MDGRVEEVLGAHEVNELESLGQLCLELHHELVDLLDDLVGVGTGGLCYRAQGADMPVDPSYIFVAPGSEFDSRHVLEPQQGSVVLGLDHEILVVRDVLIAAAVAEYVSEGVVGLGSERAGGGLEVLFVEHRPDVRRHEPVFRHLARVEPDA